MTQNIRESIQGISRLVIRLGYEITQNHPEIAEEFRGGQSHADIGDILLNNGFSHVRSRAVRTNSVRQAFIGNDNPDLGPTYEPLIPREEYDEIVAAHTAQSGRDSDKVCRKKGTGLYSSDIDRTAQAKNGAISRYQVPWGIEETSDLLSYAKTYRQSPKRADAARLKLEINAKYHKGVPVRTINAITSKLEREKARQKKKSTQ